MSDSMEFLHARIVRYSIADEAMVTADSILADLPGWGSLPALQLLAAVEAEYDIGFEIREFLEMTRVGELAQAIDERRGCGRVVGGIGSADGIGSAIRPGRA